jgi:hypothetical protein
MSIPRGRRTAQVEPPLADPLDLSPSDFENPRTALRVLGPMFLRSAETQERLAAAQERIATALEQLATVATRR